MFYSSNESISMPKQYLQQSGEEFKMVLVNAPKGNAHRSSVKRSSNRMRGTNLLYDTFKPKATSTPYRLKPVFRNATELTTNCFKPLTMSQFVGKFPQTYQNLNQMDGFSPRPSAACAEEVAVKLQKFIGQTSKSSETIFLEDSIDKRYQPNFLPVPGKCFSHAKDKNVNHVNTMMIEQPEELPTISSTTGTTLASTITGNSTGNDLKLIFKTKQSVNQCDGTNTSKYVFSDKKNLSDTFLGFEKYLEQKMSKLLNNTLSPYLIRSFVKESDGNAAQSYCTTLTSEPPMSASFKLPVGEYIQNPDYEKANIFNKSTELDMDKTCLWNESKSKGGRLIDVLEFWKQDDELYLLVDYLECN